MSELEIDEVLQNALLNMENFRKTGEFVFFFSAKEQVETALKMVVEETEAEDAD